MSYFLRIYDNFHYMDESEVYDYGNFETYEEALKEAKLIIDDFFEDSLKTGSKPEGLSALWSMFGEDPCILPVDVSLKDFFSARSYAAKRAEEIIQSRKKNSHSVPE